MFRLLFAFLVCLYSWLNLTAQQITFNKTIDMIGTHEINLGTVEAIDGYFILHNTITPIAEDMQLILAKLDHEGNMEWNASFCRDSSICALPGGASLHYSHEGNLLAVGQYKSGPNGVGNAMIYELSPEGDSIRLITLPSESLEGFHNLNLLQGGGYIACGQSSFEAPGGDLFLVRLDHEFHVLWERRFGGAGWQVAYSVDQTPDGGFVVCGKQYLYFNTTEILLYKTDSLGNIEWSRTVGDEGNNDGRHNVRVLRDSTLLVSATVDYGSIGQEDAYLAKLDMDGEIIWEESNPIGTTRFNTNIIELADGHIVLAGGREVFSTEAGGFRRHVMIRKYTPEGELVWERLHHGRPDISNYFYGLLRAGDGGFVGYGSSYGPDNATLQDGWIVKMDSQGNACEDLGCLLVDMAEVRAGRPQLLLSPNPAWEDVYLDYRLPEALPELSVSIFDARGRCTWRYREAAPTAEGTIHFSAADWPAGLYVVRLESAGRLVAARKLVVR